MRGNLIFERTLFFVISNEKFFFPIKEMKLKIVKIIISVKFGTTFVDSDTFSCVRLWRTRASGKGGGKEDSVVRIENAWILYYVYISVPSSI